MGRRQYNTLPLEDEYTLILDVRCEGVTDLEDRSKFSHPQIGGVGSISDYSDDAGIACLLNPTYGTKPRWLLNKAICPMILEVNVKLFGIRGHGWAFEFRNSNDTNWILGHGYSYSGRNRFNLNSKLGNCIRDPSIPMNVWTHIKIEYDLNKTTLWLNGNLDKVIEANLTTQMCHNFSIRYANDDQFNNANIAFKNIKIYTKNKAV